MNITGGIYNGRKIKAPDEKITRPTLSKAREGIFSCLYSLVDFKECSFLDMFSGSGIMGLEAISRGFQEVICFEKNIKAANVIKENYKTLNIKPTLYIGNSLKLIEKQTKAFDVIFIDPPYFSGIYEECLSKIIQSNSIKKDGIIILEHVSPVELTSFELEVIKQKTYSNKTITFLKY